MTVKVAPVSISNPLRPSIWYLLLQFHLIPLSKSNRRSPWLLGPTSILLPNLSNNWFVWTSKQYLNKINYFSFINYIIFELFGYQPYFLERLEGCTFLIISICDQIQAILYTSIPTIIDDILSVSLHLKSNLFPRFNR